MARCRHKVGLLSLRDCGQPVVALCSQCNRPVCEKHTKPGDGGSLCTECHALTLDEAESRGEAYRHRQRREIYHNYGYNPYYYGSSRRFGDDDYHYFDADVETSFEDEDDSLEPADFQDS